VRRLRAPYYLPVTAQEGGERPIEHIAQDLEIGAETLLKHVRRAQSDVGREWLSTNQRAEFKRLRRENFELRRANSILEEASVFSRRSSITL
jgi:transposase